MANKKITFGVVALISIAAISIFLISNSIGSGVDIPEEKRKVYIHSISLQPGNYSSVDGNNVRGEILLYLSYHCPYYGLKSYEDIKWYIDDEYVGSSFPVKWDTTLYGDGTHKVRVEATNVVGYTGRKEISVNVDNTGPWFRIINPKDGEEVEGVIFPEIEVKDDSEIEDVKWFLGNGSWTKIVTQGERGVFGPWNGGRYILIASVTDKIGNVKNDSINIFITTPDLSINPAETIIPLNLQLGDTVELSAVIRNIGSVDASNVDVGFYDGERFYEKTKEIGSEVIASLPVGDSVLISKKWTPSDSGPHEIIAVADPENWIIENTETNNFVKVIVWVKNITDTPGGSID